MLNSSLLHAHAASQFSLSPDPSLWGAYLLDDKPEQDDFLHNPDPRRDRSFDHGGNIFTKRGIANLGCVILLIVGLIALLYVDTVVFVIAMLTFRVSSAGYPIISHFLKSSQSSEGGFNLGGINSTGQVRHHQMFSCLEC